MTWTSKRRLRTDLAAEKATTRRLRAELTQARADMATRGWNRRSAESIATDLIVRTSQLTEAKTALRDTEDQLGQARQRIAALTTRRATAWQNAGRRAEQYQAERLAQAERIKEGSTTG